MAQTEISSGIQGLLTQYLEQLSEEELVEFQLLLSTKGDSSFTVTKRQLTKRSGMEVASYLVARYGEQSAWNLALHVWEQMGLKKLCTEAWKEKDLMPRTPYSKTSSSSGQPPRPKREYVLSIPIKSGLSQKGDPFPLLQQALLTTSLLEHEATGQAAVSGTKRHPPKSSLEPHKQKPLGIWLSTEALAHRSYVFLQSLQGRTERYQNWRREELCLTQFWKNEDLLQKFTQLLLVQNYPRSLELLSRKGWYLDVAQERGHLIEIQDLFDPHMGTQKKPQIVILHGAAGIGKSTLARQVRKAWKEGQLFTDCFQHVFYVNCRELAQCKPLSLAELISNDDASSQTPMGQIMSQPEKLLFILDGVDEPEWVLDGQNPELCVHWSQQQPVHALLGSLLGRSTLPEASLLITTRTVALQKFIPSLRKAHWVEVLGFSESCQKEYFYNYFSEEHQASEAFSLVESNPVLLTLCLVPWVSWLVCTCLKQQMDQGEDLSLTFQTTTALCLHYLSQALQALQARPLGTELTGLCSLAVEGICERKTLFSPRDLREHGLDEAVIATFLKMGVLQKYPCSPLYSFTHLFLQEFFAAMSLALALNKQGRGRFESFRIVERLIGMFGLCELFETPTMCFLFGLLSEPGVREMEKIFNCQMSLDARWELLSRTRLEVCLQPPYLLRLFHCLYEIQDKEFLTQVMLDFHETSVCVIMDMEHPVVQTNMKSLVVKTDVDLLVVTFCLKFCSHIKKLQVNGDGRPRTALSSAREHLYSWPPLTNASWKILFSTSGIIISLEELDLSGNPLRGLAMQMLCETLKHPDCCLKTLRLVNCGLTSSCCQYLALVLSTSTSLTELDLRKNDLGDQGVRLLCEGLRHPTCCLRLLCLDQYPLSEQMRMELRVLQSEKLQLLISSTWKQPGMNLTQTGDDIGELDNSITSLEQLKLQSDTESPQVMKLESLHLSQTEFLGTEDAFWGSMGPVATEVVDKDRNLYRVHFPLADSYHWPSTGLCFVVRRAVTIEIEFCSWGQFLGKTPLQHSHTVAGPLFDIRAEEGAVAAVHLPHFVALQDFDKALFQVAHFKEEEIILEKPAKVEQHYIVLENPSFSPVGVLLRMIPASWCFIPISSATLLYYQIKEEGVRFHLYLIPNDCTIRKAIDDEEKGDKYVQIRKPPPREPLFLGSRYIVTGSEMLKILPKELELCYRSPGQCQLFSEIYASNMSSDIELQMKNKEDLVQVWEALLTKGDISPIPPSFPTTNTDSPVLAHFIDSHREQLVARVTSVDSILDKLLGPVLNEEEYEEVRAKATTSEKLRKLFSFSRSWNRAVKDKVFQALKETHPHLIMDLM